MEQERGANLSHPTLVSVFGFVLICVSVFLFTFWSVWVCAGDRVTDEAAGGVRGRARGSAEEHQGEDIPGVCVCVRVWFSQSVTQSLTQSLTHPPTYPRASSRVVFYRQHRCFITVTYVRSQNTYRYHRDIGGAVGEAVEQPVRHSVIPCVARVRLIQEGEYVREKVCVCVCEKERERRRERER